MIKKILYQSPSARQIVSNLQNNISQTITSTTIGEKSLIVFCAEKGIVIADDFIEINKIKESLENLGKKCAVISSITETPVFSKYADLTSFYEMISKILDYYYNEIDYLFITPNLLLQKLPNLNTLTNNILEFSKDENYDFNKISQNLTKIGYSKVDAVEAKGQFSIRGDIVDIFAINHDQPIRINFWGEDIETINFFNVMDLLKTEDIETVKIYPATLFFFDESEEDDIKKLLINSANESKIQGDAILKQQAILNDVFTLLETHDRTFCLDYIIPCLKDFNQNLLSYFKDEKMFFCEPTKIVNTLQFLSKSFHSSTFDFINNGELLPFHYEYFFNYLDVFNSQYKSLTIFENVKTEQQILKTEQEINLRILGAQKYTFDFKLLLKDIIMLKQNDENVILCCDNKENMKIMQDFLTNNCINYLLDVNNIEKTSGNIYVVMLNVSYSASFLDGKIVFIGSEDLFKKAAKTIKLSNKKDAFFLPKIGDVVVHSFFGIGKCIALEKLQLSGTEKDYFVLEYAGGDKLYVPSEQANLISSFQGSDREPKLNKLGNDEFAKLKAKVKENIKQLAINLVELYSQREKTKGFVYSDDNYLMEKFEDDFEFDETPDQLKAISEIKKDMMGKKIMDRLICGDVGFGKTEVALRAAYKAILDGKQVAFLCPTSILSQQHYETCRKRFEGFMVNVAVLNRLKTTQQQKAILENIKEGKVDIICGTHRLLSNDVKFKNLGLLILDEEQRFGVMDKEKIKNIKKDIDVLTLSATPIPRTLHISLSGIRDISIIETPPKERLPIQTSVTEYSDTLLADVCKREIARGGQILIVYNRVESIDNFKNRVQELLPEISIGVAHGQMQERALEQAITNLYNGTYQILVATTLIENGIDLPRANTLFVVDSDKLGLSQLYQLRGRIGRSDRLAYAYFTYDGNKVLTEEAYKRLGAILEFTELGSGFKIAMRDLEIRGAGNILGKEQHGQIEKVGYDMYSKLLAEAVKEIKGENEIELQPIKVDIQIDAFIPEKYIPSQEQRIRAYTNISNLLSVQDMNQLKLDFCESFGDSPVVVNNLMAIALLKNLAQRVGVKRVIISPTKCELHLYKTENIISEQTAKVIEVNKMICVLKFAELPIINFNINNMSITQKINKVIEILANCQHS